MRTNATQSISQGADSSPWQILDTIALGNRALNLTAPIPFSQALARIGALNEYEASDPEMPCLTVNVNGGRVEARYSVSPEAASSRVAPGHLGILSMVRPVFRGCLSGDDQGARLRGWFGVNTLTRVLGFASVVVVFAFVVGALLHRPLGIGNVAWIVPAAFVVMCLLTRANGDDLGYMQKNLEYAFYGDSGS